MTLLKLKLCTSGCCLLLLLSNQNSSLAIGISNAGRVISSFSICSNYLSYSWGLRLIIAFSLTGIYDSLPSFSTNVRPMNVKWHLLGDIFNPHLVNALKMCVKSSKFWSFLEKNSVIHNDLALSVFRMFSNTS